MLLGYRGYCERDVGADLVRFLPKGSLHFAVFIQAQAAHRCYQCWDQNKQYNESDGRICVGSQVTD